MDAGMRRRRTDPGIMVAEQGIRRRRAIQEAEEFVKGETLGEGQEKAGNGGRM